MMLGYKGGLQIGETFVGTRDDVGFEGKNWKQNLILP